MFKANYHTHTKRCGHAIGEDEEYVLEAIGKGFKYLGFSDHAMIPNFEEPKIRGSYQNDFDDYIESISSLKKKYASKIKIFVGFEAESFANFFSFFKELLDNNVLDYMILGNHIEINDNNEIINKFSRITSASQLYRYRDLAINAMRSKMYSIFAHPDYFLQSISNFDSDCKKVSKDLINCAIENDIPLEVNVGGIRNGIRKIGDQERWIYPTDFFFSLASKMNAKCIIGEDSHAPNQIFNEAANYEAIKFSKKHELKLVDVLDSIKDKK